MDNNQFFVPVSIEKEEYAGIWEFLLHSDCDGHIEPEMCLKVAEDLEKLVIPNIDNFDLNANGHILAQGGYKEVLLKFIKGCKLAAKRKQKLRFR